MLRTIRRGIQRTNIVGFWNEIWRRLYGQPLSKNNSLLRGTARWSASRPSCLRLTCLRLTTDTNWGHTWDWDTLLDGLRRNSSSGRKKVTGLQSPLATGRRQFEHDILATLRKGHFASLDTKKLRKSGLFLNWVRCFETRAIMLV